MSDFGIVSVKSNNDQITAFILHNISNVPVTWNFLDSLRVS